MFMRFLQMVVVSGARDGHTDTKRPSIWDNEGIKDCSVSGPVNVQSECY